MNSLDAAARCVEAAKRLLDARRVQIEHNAMCLSCREYVSTQTLGCLEGGRVRSESAAAFIAWQDARIDADAAGCV